METKFKTFGNPLTFPLPMNADWVRIQCGADGQPNYIFGIDGLKAFYNAGTGIYCRDKDGRPTETLEHWITWYEKEKDERIKSYSIIQEIKSIVRKNPELMNNGPTIEI